MQLPFEHLNLRRNPFAAVSLEEHAQLAVADVNDHVRYLGEPGRVLEFTGQRGRGKTTHLLAIRRHFPHAPYLRVSRDPNKLKSVTGAVIFVDEAQFLTDHQARRLFDTDSSYAVSTHTDITRFYERAGLRHRSVAVEGLDRQRLARIVDRRLKWARRDDDEIPRINNDALDALIERHGDNLRSIEEHLYEVFQRLEQIREVVPNDLI